MIVVIGILAVVLGNIAVRANYTHEVVSIRSASDFGKVKAAGQIERQLTESPTAFLLGAGPAQAVSFSALLSLDPLKDPDTPVRFLNLEPSQMLLDLGAHPRATHHFFTLPPVP